MKILVPFKRVPEADAQSMCGTLDEARWMINPFDEIALEEALRLKERGLASEIAGVTISSCAAEDQIRAALAMGIDRAIRVEDSRELDPYAVARLLAGIVRQEQPALVIMGKQAVDDDAGQVGQMLAGLLEWPQATFVSQIEFSAPGRQARCVRETDRGLETIEVCLPAVFTADLRLNEPRYVSLPATMKARRLPIEVVTPEQLGVSVQPRTTVLATVAAPRRNGGARVASLEDLLSRLRQHDQVL
jgi:electron transfer flavoprotein beta subunit